MTPNSITESKNIRVTDCFMPVIYINLCNTLSKIDYTYLADYFESLLKQETRSVMIIDLRSVVRLKLIESTRFWVPWATKHKGQIDVLSCGSAFVSNNKVVLKVVNTILTVLPLTTPMRVFDSLEAALEWSLRQIDGKGLILEKRPTLTDLTV